MRFIFPVRKSLAWQGVTKEKLRIIIIAQDLCSEVTNYYAARNFKQNWDLSQILHGLENYETLLFTIRNESFILLKKFRMRVISLDNCRWHEANKKKTRRFCQGNTSVTVLNALRRFQRNMTNSQAASFSCKLFEAFDREESKMFICWHSRFI